MEKIHTSGSTGLQDMRHQRQTISDMRKRDGGDAGGQWVVVAVVVHDDYLSSILDALTSTSSK